VPIQKLPERPSLEYLKKIAKDCLRKRRLTDPKARLTAAHLSVAREYGFASWRALKSELERVKDSSTAQYFEACTNSDVSILMSLLAAEPSLVHVSQPKARFGGWTGLHEAAKLGHSEVVRLLLAHGADPNAREAGDSTFPLHWAAAHRHNEVIKVLLDAGADVHGEGDAHALGIIGWGTYFHDPGTELGDKPETAALLVKRGARHHVFSAMSLGDLNLVREVVLQNSSTLAQKMSPFEDELTPLHFALHIGRRDLLRLLIELGANVEAKDKNGLTVLESAMLRADSDAVTELLAAGARKPKRARFAARRALSKVSGSIGGLKPMIYVPDVAATLDWYVSLGFTETARYEEDGLVNFGIVRLGKAEILINMNGRGGEHDVSLWFSTDRVDEIYARLKTRQIRVAFGGTHDDFERIDFVEHINDTFYGARQFAIRDPNGYVLYFIQ
jgi:catechol 2,3-dioxygenase-like lactoylglutathione lyase family enzyme